MKGVKQEGGDYVVLSDEEIRHLLGCTTTKAACATWAMSAPAGMPRRARRCTNGCLRSRSRLRPSGAVKPGRWSRRAAGSEHWVQPRLVAEVSFTEWTPDGQIRHPSFEGLREDKPATGISAKRRRAPWPPSPARQGEQSRARDRPVERRQEARPRALLRERGAVDAAAPPGAARLARARTAGHHRAALLPEAPGGAHAGITELNPALRAEHAELMQVDTAEALVSAAQMNVIEFHTWNALSAKIDKPDRIVFELDPGEGTPWLRVKEAALLTRTLLEELGLASFLKTSGGKGLHVVVPAHAEGRLGDREGPVAGGGAAPRQDDPRPLRGQVGPVEPGRQAIRGLPAQQPRGDDRTAFSARARPGLGVSMPISWKQLNELKSGAQWTVLTAREQLPFQTADPGPTTGPPGRRWRRRRRRWGTRHRASDRRSGALLEPAARMLSGDP